MAIAPLPTKPEVTPASLLQAVERWPPTYVAAVCSMSRRSDFQEVALPNDLLQHLIKRALEEQDLHFQDHP
jgi:hypothetical protein